MQNAIIIIYNMPNLNKISSSKFSKINTRGLSSNVCDMDSKLSERMSKYLKNS